MLKLQNYYINYLNNIKFNLINKNSIFLIKQIQLKMYFQYIYLELLEINRNDKEYYEIYLQTKIFFYFFLLNIAINGFIKKETKVEENEYSAVIINDEVDTLNNIVNINLKNKKLISNFLSTCILHSYVPLELLLEQSLLFINKKKNIVENFKYLSFIYRIKLNILSFNEHSKYLEKHKKGCFSHEDTDLVIDFLIYTVFKKVNIKTIIELLIIKLLTYLK